MKGFSAIIQRRPSNYLMENTELKNIKLGAKQVVSIKPKIK